MKRNRWHLDVSFPKLYLDRWSFNSISLLNRIFQHLDKSEAPVLTMLPPGINPGDAAIIASLYFLPGMKLPPEPHCKIALFPGLHYLNQIKNVEFDSEAMWEATVQARVLGRGSAIVDGPIDKLRERHKTFGTANYHWIFRCSRVWERYGKKEFQDVTPRNYYGRKDPFDPSIEIFETHRMEIVKSDIYDLLIYCPSFHSYSLGQNQDEVHSIQSKIDSFPAERKLILVRSPYDFWARLMESRLKFPGIGLSTSELSVSDVDFKKTVEFIIVDQFISLKEAFILYQELKKAANIPSVNNYLISEFKAVLKRLLISLDPASKDNDVPLEDLPYQLDQLIKSIGISPSSEAAKVIDQIKLKISENSFFTKLGKIAGHSKGTNLEVWVTKELDRKILEEYSASNDLGLTIRLAERWITPGMREGNKSVLLSRIDREADLNLVAYLSPGDTVVMSSWEAVVRGVSILKSWEHSEKWRQNSIDLGILPKDNQVQFADPVLDLANYLDGAIGNLKRNVEVGDPKIEDSLNWWDENNAQSIFDTTLDRRQLLLTSGADSYFCKEVLFDGDYGMFVREEDSFQVIEEVDEKGEIEEVSVNNLKPGMTLLLFKDAERNSMFDLLLDQLERSSEHQHDARTVREWKAVLKNHVIKSGHKIQKIGEMLEAAGKKFDYVTIRSWIYGSTMAPQKIDNLVLLIKTLKIVNINPKILYKSVLRLRSIAITLGRALNQLILYGDLDRIDSKVREALLELGVDIEELSSAIEMRIVKDVSKNKFQVEPANIKKIFKL